MEPRGEKSGETDGVRVTPQLLKARSGEFALESILLLKLQGLGLVDLGCLGECLGLEWLDLSGNALTQLGPLASLHQLAVLNVAHAQQLHPGGGLPPVPGHAARVPRPGSPGQGQPGPGRAGAQPRPRHFLCLLNAPCGRGPWGWHAVASLLFFMVSSCWPLALHTGVLWAPLPKSSPPPSHTSIHQGHSSLGPSSGSWHRVRLFCTYACSWEEARPPRVRSCCHSRLPEPEA